MTALIFLFAVAVIFGAVLALEVSPPEAESLRPAGLIRWLTGGNWPAKVGGGLLVVGVGSLLHYALINFDVAPPVKLLTGVLASALLGLAATLTRIGTGRRAVSLALGGAAFGVAYLTAYSAFALFHYLESLNGVALLGLTALGAAVYAISRSSLSLALLAMLGAFLAPAFAIDDPGPRIVYGYYCAASLMTLFMVAWRGWRPLIHLSFLFTLAGGVFFAWTAHYYGPQHADVMLVALLVLTAIHVLMPLVERNSARRSWIERLDVAYAIALPAVAALLAVLLAPDRSALASELIGLGTVWLAVAVYLGLARADGLALHVIVGALLAGLGVAARYRDLPWELVALAFSVGSLWLAARYSKSERLHSVLAGFVPVFGFVHVAATLSPMPGSPVFANGRFVERLIGAGLLIFAGYVCRRLRQSLDTLLISVGIGWALLAIGAELVRWNLVSLPILLHWILILAAFLSAVVPSVRSRLSTGFTWLPIGIALSATWAALSASQTIAWISLAGSSTALLAVALRDPREEIESRTGRLLAVVLAPLVAGIWAVHAGDLLGIREVHFALSVAVIVALAELLAARVDSRASADWRNTFAEIAAVAFSLLLCVTTMVAIVRSPWASMLDLLCIAGLIGLAATEDDRGTTSRWIGPAAALGTGLVVQAALLRQFGPPGDLSFADVAHMRLPTLVSLVWATLGALLTLWGRRRGMRSWWVAGAVLLVAAAVKLVLVDFGSLGQLTNIFAMIAAGVVFMLVGWFAPIPPPNEPAAHPSSPAPPTPPPPPPPPPPASRPVGPASPASSPAPSGAASDKAQDFSSWNAPRTPFDPAARDTSASDRKAAWTIAVLAMFILPLAHCSQSTRDRVRSSLGFAAPVLPLPPVTSGRNPPVMHANASRPAVNPPVETACSHWAAKLPAEFSVYAAGGRAGRELDFTLPNANHLATRFDVVVHEPERKVVLVLGAYEPSIWTVKWSPATQIVGVWISGHFAQEVTGLNADTPVLRTVASEAGPCPSFFIQGGNVAPVTVAVNRVLSHDIDKVILANNGYIDIGHTEESTQYLQGEVRALETFRDPSHAAAGDLGIAQLLQSGALRRATLRDMNARVTSMNRVGGAPGSTPGLQSNLADSTEVPRTFVIQRSMAFPGGLYGTHSVTFLLPRSAERPQGDPGDSRIIEIGY